MKKVYANRRLTFWFWHRGGGFVVNDVKGHEAGEGAELVGEQGEEAALKVQPKLGQPLGGHRSHVLATSRIQRLKHDTSVLAGEFILFARK